MDHKNNPLEIHTNQLDAEWQHQPELYWEYAVQLADARLRLVEMQQELEVIKAELDLCIRQDPSAFNIAKVTEASINSAIVMQREYHIAQKRMNQAKHAVDTLVGFVTALDHRKKALEKLVDLHLSNYFSAPKNPDAKNRDIIEANVRKRLQRAALEAEDG